MVAPTCLCLATINSNFLKLKAGYLFPEIARRVKAYTEANSDKAGRIIRCGIGDVTEPLPSAVRDAMHAAVDEQGDRATFKGYGPEQGYEFLRHQYSLRLGRLPGRPHVMGNVRQDAR